MSSSPFLFPPGILVISGSRSFQAANLELARSILMDLPRSTLIRHGDCARGADRLVGELAESLGFAVRRWPARWDVFGGAAGPVRNRQMLTGANISPEMLPIDNPPADALLAFWDGKSRGTAGCIELARAHRIPVHVVRF